MRCFHANQADAVLAPDGRHSPERVPTGEHTRLRHVQSAAQVLRAEHGLGELVADHRIQVERRERIERRRSGVEDGARGSRRLLIRSGHGILLRD